MGSYKFSLTYINLDPGHIEESSWICGKPRNVTVKLLTVFIPFQARKKDCEELYNSFTANNIQCPPLNRITLGPHKSDNCNQMIQ